MNRIMMALAITVLAATANVALADDDASAPPANHDSMQMSAPDAAPPAQADPAPDTASPDAAAAKPDAN